MGQSGITLDSAPFSRASPVPLSRADRNIPVQNQLLEATMYRGVMDACVSRSTRLRVHRLGTIPAFGLVRCNGTRPRAVVARRLAKRFYNGCTEVCTTCQTPATLISGARRRGYQRRKPRRKRSRNPYDAWDSSQPHRLFPSNAPMQCSTLRRVQACQG
jgi:hypothetical protein